MIDSYTDFGIDFVRGEKLISSYSKTKDPGDVLIKDFLILDLIRTLESHVYEICYFCYALSKSARILSFEATAKKL